MKVALFHSTLPEPGRKVGGVEVFVHRLANHLTRRGHDVTVLTYAAARPADAEYRMRRIGSPRLARHRVTRLTVCSALLNRVTWDDFDVVGLHGDDWLFVRRPLPTVRTFHGSALREAQSAVRLRRKMAQYLVYPAELVASRLAVRSYTACAGMPRGYRLDGMLPLGIGLDTDADQQTVRKEPVPTILFVGTWDGRKRGRMLRDVFEAEVLPRVPEAQLWMVTDQCEETGSVRRMTAPTDADLAALYQRSWVFCLPSTYEGFGQPYVEAMIGGSAAVATPNPGARMVFDNGRYGVLAEDPKLGDTLVALLEHSEMREHYVAAGLQRAEHFSWDAACEAYDRALLAVRAEFRDGSSVSHAARDT